MKPTRIIGLLATVTLLVIGAYVGLHDQLVEVETVRVERGDLELVIRVTGEVINDRQVSLTALMDGQVNHLGAALGDRVSTGQVLASMDNRVADARWQQAKAYVQQVDVHRREQRINLTRIERLSAKGAVSQEDMDAARLAWEAANAAWDVAKADLRLAEVARDWQQVKSPFDAVVIGKSTEIGQWVEAGTQLFTLVSLDPWEIEAHVDAVDSGRVKPGQSVIIRCDAFPDIEWASEVDWIGPSVEREKDKRLNTFSIRLGLGEHPPNLLLGQQVDLEIAIDHRQDVIKLPFAALRDTGEGAEVGLIESGQVRYKSITTGLEGDTHVEVLAGLKPGMELIRLDGMALEEGSYVRLAESP